MTAPVCTGHGASDTHALILNDGRPNPHPSAGQAYGTLDATALWDMVQAPPTVAKEQSQWIIPSAYHAYDARSHTAQREHGQYWYLAADIDKGDPSLADVSAIAGLVLGNVATVIYSSRSATPANKKWRILVPLAEPLSGAEYGAYQAAWFDALEHSGLQVDRTLERAGQLIYLPNRGELYQWQADPAPLLDARHHPMAPRAREYQAIWFEIESGRSSDDRKEGPLSVLKAFREKHSIEEMLRVYGYTQRGTSNHWRSPHQRSGGYATRCMDDHWYSLSDSDAAAGLGIKSGKSGRYGDAFDLYTHFQCGGDREKAMLYARQCWEEANRFFIDHGEQMWYQWWEADQAEKARYAEQERQSREESREFEKASKAAERKRWSGDWVSEVPFRPTDLSALEWAAWHAPGALGAMVKAKAPQATRHSLVPLLAGAIATMSYLTVGKFVLRYKHHVTPPSLMTYLVGDTGSSKGDADSMFKEMLNLLPQETEAQMPVRVLRNFASGEAVIDYLANHVPNVVLVQAEAGASRAANKGSQRHEAVAAELTDIFTAFKGGIAATHAKTQGLETKAVHNPTISALLLSTPKKLFKSIEGGDAESGWLGRYLFLHLPISPAVADTAPDVQYPAGLLQYMQQLAALAPAQWTLGDHRVWNGRERSFHAIYYSPDAEAYMKECDASFDAKVMDMRYSGLERALYSRAAEMVSRLSFIAGLATAVDRKVGIEACQWARVVVEASIAFVTSRMENVVDDDEDLGPPAKIRTGVVNYFKRAGADEKFFRGFGLNARRNIDGEVELAESVMKIRLRDNQLKKLNIRPAQVTEEVQQMISDGLLVDLGIDLNKRRWLRYVR